MLNESMELGCNRHGQKGRVSGGGRNGLATSCTHTSGRDASKEHVDKISSDLRHALIPSAVHQTPIIPQRRVEDGRLLRHIGDGPMESHAPGAARDLPQHCWHPGWARSQCIKGAKETIHMAKSPWGTSSTVREKDDP